MDHRKLGHQQSESHCTAAWQLAWPYFGSQGCYILTLASRWIRYTLWQSNMAIDNSLGWLTHWTCAHHTDILHRLYGIPNISQFLLSRCSCPASHVESSRKPCAENLTVQVKDWLVTPSNIICIYTRVYIYRVIYIHTILECKCLLLYMFGGILYASEKLRSSLAIFGDHPKYGWPKKY